MPNLPTVSEVTLENGKSREQCDIDRKLRFRSSRREQNKLTPECAQGEFAESIAGTCICMIITDRRTWRELAPNRCLTLQLSMFCLLFLLLLVATIVVALFALCRLLTRLLRGGRGSLSAESRQ